MKERVKDDVEALVEELSHVLWAAAHPAMIVDRSIVDLLTRCKTALEATERQDV